MRWIASLRTIGVALVLLPLLAISAPAVGAEPQVAVSETSNEGVYEFDARGFFDDEDVSTWLTGPQGQVMASGSYTTDNRGRVEFRQRMPQHFQPGRWAITVHGLRSNREAIGYFDLPYRAPNATVTVSPASLSNGDTLTVEGEGFGREDRVSFWFNGPDGVEIAGPYFVTSTSNGRVSFAFIIAGFQPGGWSISLAGNRSDDYGVATFEVV